MYGFQAISAHSGWSMAIIGILIDLSCLVVLSILISQLHKMLEFWENRGKKSAPEMEMPAHSKAESTPAKKITLPHRFPDDVQEAALLYQPLIEKIGQQFQLAELYKAAQENDYPHPHLTISSFRQAGILSAGEEGTFTWNN